MMAGQSGYLIPNPIDPLQRRCVKVWVPNSQLHIAAFFGSIADLTNYFTWEHDTPEKEELAKEAARIWEGVLSAAREYWESGECELPIELRNNGGVIEWRPDGSAGWTSLGEACPCPTVVTSPQYNPDMTTPDELGCTVSVGLVIWFMDKLGDVLDAITFATSTARAIDAILVIFPPAYLLADQVSDMIFEITDATVAAVAAADTVEFREALQEFLYCRIRGTGELTQDVWDEIKQALLDGDFGNNVAYPAIYAYLDSFEWSAIEARARIESYNVPSNCIAFDCEGSWEQEFIFPGIGMEPWEIETIALYPSGTGQAGVYNWSSDNVDSVVRRLQSNDYRDIALIKVAFAPRIITRVEMTGTGITPSGATPAYTTEIFYGGARIGGQRNLGGATGGTDIIDNVEVDKVTVRISYQKTTAFTGGNGHISGVKLYGKGTNPFLP